MKSWRRVGATTVLILALGTGCNAGQGISSPPQPSISLVTAGPTSTPRPSPSASPTRSPGPTATAVAASAPPPHAGDGPAPILPQAIAVDDPLRATDGLLDIARARISQLSSFRFWTSIAGGGVAADGLVPGQPLIMAGTVDVGDSVDAAWSLTNLDGYAGRTIRYRVIDGTVWCDSGVELWTVFDGSDAELARADAAAMEPHAFFAATFLSDDVDFRAVSLDRFGDIPAIRFEAVDAETLSIQGWWTGMPGEIRRFALWVGEDGTPLQSEVTGVVRGGDETGEFREQVQLGGIDDPDNVIEPPI